MSARIPRLSDLLRVTVVGGALLAAAGSAGSSKSGSPAQGPRAEFASPAPRHMEPDRAIGLWRSSFGPVKIERDPQAAAPEAVQGAWRYSRDGQEVVGVFWGTLRGNVLDFQWHEPGVGVELRGQGYLVFDPSGDRFSGKWWTAGRDRYGDWNGWRPRGLETDDPSAPPAGDAAEEGAYPEDDGSYPEDDGNYPEDDGGGYPEDGPPPPGF